MIDIAFDGTWEGWRAAARRCLAGEVSPAMIVWLPTTETQQWLLAPDTPPPEPTHRPAKRVPRQYMELASACACYRTSDRWSLLYRVLWRLTHGESRLLDDVVDSDVHRMLRMEKSVRRDTHKMKAFVRFRKVTDEEGDRYVAWFAPQHEIVRRAAPFFTQRFVSMRWSILTPDISAHWDTSELTVTEGVAREHAPRDDEMESLWRTYYANIFNPARLNTHAMRAEMPKKYWHGLPEARLIPELVRGARERVTEMIQKQQRS